MIDLRNPAHLIAVLSSLAAVTLFFVPAPQGFNPQTFEGAALTLFAIGLYATGALPEALTAIAFFALAMLLQIAPANVTFAGFESAAFWLVFGGFVIGIAVKQTGLGTRIADSVIGRLGTRYPFLVAGMIITGIALAFAMPSTMGRVVLLTPVVVLLTERLGYKPGSRETIGLVMAAACGTWMPSAAILPANVPSMVIAGMAESLYGISFEYGEYLLLHFPITGALRAVLIFFIIITLYRGSPGVVAQTAKEEQGDKSRQRLLSIILIITLGLWMGDFIHHISPAWIALGAAVVCMLPVCKLVPMKDFNTMNVGMLVYIAAILSLGPVIAHTGAGEYLGELVLSVLPLQPGNDFSNFMSLVGLGAVTGVASTAPGVGAVLGPLAQDLATASGFPLKTVLMTQVVGYSLVLLPYQVPPLIIAMQLGGVPLREGTKITLSIAVLTFTILTPLNFAWWQVLGMFG